MWQVSFVPQPEVTGFIEQLELQLLDGDELQVSVVEYGTEGILTSGLTTPDLATTAVNGIAYSGGYTNLEQAIDECKKTLVGSPAPVTVIIGDGNPTAVVDSSDTCTDGSLGTGSLVCKNAAEAAADELFVGVAEKRPQTSSAHLMLPGGPCTQSDEDPSVMTIGSDRRCRRPKRSTSPRDEARSPHMDARKKSNKNTEQNSVCSSSPPAGAALTVYHIHVLKYHV